MKRQFIENSIYNGIQRIYHFENGYGASLVKHDFSYGGKEGYWEMALIKFIDGDISNYEICCREGFEDVMGWLTDEEVEVKLKWIEELKDSYIVGDEG